MKNGSVIGANALVYEEYEYTQTYREHERQRKQQMARQEALARVKWARAGKICFAVVVIAMLAVTAVGTVYVKAQFSGTQFHINQLQAQIETRTTEKSRLTSQRDAYTNIAAIKQRAEEMGMGFPAQNDLHRVSGSTQTSMEKQE